MICSGLYTAMITPFDERGKVDETAFQQHIQNQEKERVDGIVVLGTTGEVPTLTLKEKERLVSLARKEVKNLHLMVGCGTPSTQQTLDNLKWATDLGAQSALIITPYYNKPTQEGLYRHYETLSNAALIPIIVYNIKGRTGVNIETSTLKQIAELPQIAGVKESSGDIAQAAAVIYEIKQSRPDFAVLSGDDGLTLPLMALGADGVISATSNLVPHKMKQLIQACQKRDFSLAQKFHWELFPLFQALALEPNPIVIKAAMNQLPRLPLTPLSKQHHKTLQEALSCLK
ncbi:MAG: 4-hydroxy-tetrahydrodipicolinate synthase [Chlamydiales bacterium]